MRVRILVANQAEAAFYDLESRVDTLHFKERLSDPKAHLHDRDFKSDRPGRVFDHAPLTGGRRGATAHHGTGGERRPRKHEAGVFARLITDHLAQARRAGEFDHLVVMAAPAFLGLLRKAMADALRSCIVGEVTKDLAHEPPETIRAHVPQEAFHELPPE
jgi:protein required for attachment to host cells